MTAASDPLSLHDRLLAATYRCVERFGMGKTTIDDIVKESGVSRATIYRQFPGGRDEVLLETVGWELANYFNRLADQVRDAPNLAELLRRGLAFAHRSIAEHAVLRKILDTEPDRLLPLLTTESAKSLPFIADFLLPYLRREADAGRLRPGRRHRPGRRVPRPVDPVAHRGARPLGPRRPRPGRRPRRRRAPRRHHRPLNRQQLAGIRQRAANVAGHRGSSDRRARDREHGCDAGHVDDETYTGPVSQVMDFSAGDLSPKAAQVLDAALVCIGRVGLTKTTLDDVAREAGCARATVYRCFANKQQLLVALVAREAAGAARSRSSSPRRVERDARRRDHDGRHDRRCEFLANHPALTFVCAHEPEVLLPFLAFEREDAVLRTAAVLVAPAFTRFLDDADATRLGEWIARITLSYLFSPSENFDIADPAHVRALVDDFVVPGFVNSEGVSR